MPGSALETQFNSHIKTFPEVTGVLTVTRKGDALWLFVTLQEGLVLDAPLVNRLTETLRSGVQRVPERVFQLIAFPRSRSGHLMRRALERFINLHELPNRTMMQNPEVLAEIARVTGMAGSAGS